MKYVIVIIACLITCLLTGCTFDKASDIRPDKGNSSVLCDTSTVVSYSAQIAPLIASRCVSCHSPSDGTKLYDYATVKANAIRTTGSIYGAITADGTAIPMPPSGPKLSECEISEIKRWIDNGAPNN